MRLNTFVLIAAAFALAGPAPAMAQGKGKGKGKGSAKVKVKIKVKGPGKGSAKVKVTARPPGWSKGNKEGWHGNVPPGWAKWGVEKRKAHKAGIELGLTGVRAHLTGHPRKGHLTFTGPQATGLFLSLTNAGVSVEVAGHYVRGSIDAGHSHALALETAREISGAHVTLGLDFGALQLHAFDLIKKGHRGEKLRLSLNGEINRRHTKRKAAKVKISGGGVKVKTPSGAKVTIKKKGGKK